jgi:hypothetical protein
VEVKLVKTTISFYLNNVILSLFEMKMLDSGKLSIHDPDLNRIIGF